MWLAVEGPADRVERDAAPSIVGLMQSDDYGASRVYFSAGRWDIMSKKNALMQRGRA